MVAQYEEPRIFAPGDRFRDHYIVESFLGSGASGQVYAVRHQFTHDRFALKVAHVEEDRDARKERRCLLAAQATYSLRHRNIVRVVELAVEPSGLVWQLMELLEGQTVLALLRRYGRLSPLYALDIAMEAAFGLQAAHEQQVIHRDVQPANIFLTTRGEVKVLDFSEAKVLLDEVRTTQGRPAPGTTGYMAPEQQSGAAATPQFDVYALGVTLWQMLAGAHPFQTPADGAINVAVKQLRGAPSLVEAAGLPAFCDDVLRRAMANDPEQRYAGMWELTQALRELRERLAADPAASWSPPVWERALPVVRDPDGWNQYRPPRSLPRGAPAPRIPSRRVVVPVEALPAPDTDREGRRSSGVVAKTVPMAIVPDPPPRAPASGGQAPPPTVQTRRLPLARRWVWVVLLAALALTLLAAAVALGVLEISLDAAPPR